MNKFKQYILIIHLLFFGSYVSASVFEEWIQLAQQGNQDAQYNLGLIYYNGDGVVQDYKKALYWFEKSARQGDAQAQNNLGFMYYDGKGVEKDYKKSFYWYKKSAEQGIALAQKGLILMYTQGHGVEQDHEKALYWTRKAAQQGDVEAQRVIAQFDDRIKKKDQFIKNLEQNSNQSKVSFKNDTESLINKKNKTSREMLQIGLMYYDWRFVDKEHKDNQKAFYWFRKSAEKGNIDAQYRLGVMYSDGKGVEINFEKGFYWYQKSAEQGHHKAQNNLGLLYYYGTGVEKDYKKAFHWFQKSAEQENPEAQFQLGDMYEHGVEVSQNFDKAFYWYTKAIQKGVFETRILFGLMDPSFTDYYNIEYLLSSREEKADQGDSWSQFILGWIYENGNLIEGLDQNYSETLYWYEKSAQQGFALAQSHLGAMYYEGKGVDKDYKKAFYWLKKSAHQGNASAQVKLGEMYYKGKEVSKNYVQAYKWLSICKSQMISYILYELENKMTKNEIIEAQIRVQLHKINIWLIKSKVISIIPLLVFVFLISIFL